MSNAHLLEKITRHLADASRLIAQPIDNLEKVNSEAIERYVELLLFLAKQLDDSSSNWMLGSIFDPDNEQAAMGALLRNVARERGARAARVVTNGTTGANHVAVSAVAESGATLLLSRDVHQSAVVAAMLCDADVEWILPPFDAVLGITLPLTAEEIGFALEGNPRINAVVLNGVSYEGATPYIAVISRICHAHGVNLIVDEAHGAHFQGLSDLGVPAPAIGLGADLVTQSVHKTMPALSQGSVLLIGQASLVPAVDRMIGAFMTTSPSPLLFASVEFALRHHQLFGRKHWARALEHAEYVRCKLEQIPGIIPLRYQQLDPYRVSGLDPMRVTINVRELGVTGFEFMDALKERHIAAEKATHDTVLFLIGPGHDRVAPAIVSAVSEIAGVLRRVPRAANRLAVPIPEMVAGLRESFFAARRRALPLGEAVGRTSAEILTAYPPGQVVIGPGERITAAAVDFLTDVARLGGRLKPARPNGPIIEVLDI